MQPSQDYNMPQTMVVQNGFPQQYNQQQYGQQQYGQQQYGQQNNQQFNQYGQAQTNPMFVAPTNMQMPFLQPVFPTFQPKMSGFDKLMALPGVFIKQKFMMLEAMTGCEQQHRHFVYGLDSNGKHKKGSKIFKCKENSGCMMRQCCSPHCRAFDMDVKHKDYLDQSFDGSSFLKFSRDFKCSFLCLNRPVLTVSWTEGGQNQTLGKIVNPFKCCDLIVSIYNASDVLLYTIEGSCCQCGVMCEGPCFQGAEFAIKNAGGEIVGTFKRVRAGFFQNVVETLANFTVTFPPNSNGQERALFIAAAIMMDYAYFDKKKKGVAGDVAQGAIQF
jgi:hypothetical protein